MSIHWVPLESNPEVMTEWSSRLGLDTSKYQFCDVMGFDDESLKEIPEPVYAAILLFPDFKKFDDFRSEEAERIKRQGKEGFGRDSITFFKQTISNACGTMGLLHALANSGVPLAPDSDLVKLFAKCKGLSPDERAKLLESDESVANAHKAVAQMGQTKAPAAEDDVEGHFVAFVADKDNHLVELDGTKLFPIDHGPIRGGLLKTVAKVVDSLIKFTNGSTHFSLITLAAKSWRGQEYLKSI